MKLKPYRNRGALLLGLLVIILAVVVIGLVVYAIYKALSRWNPRPINPDDVAVWVQSATIELNQTPDATVLSDGTMVQRLTATNAPVFITIEMSTNLVNWHVRTNLPASEFDLFLEAEPIDKTIPMKFYRVRP